MTTPAVATDRLARLVADRERVLEDFCRRDAPALARACLDLARALHNGGLLIPYGSGAAATDAAHVAVEFLHPVIVGKRALPALAPANDPSGASRVDRLGRAGDIALVLTHRPADRDAAAVLAAARSRGLVTIAMAPDELDADHAFAVPSRDPAIVQEVQETAYHVLWELVHVFFEHPGLLEESCITCGDVAVEATVVEARGDTAVVARDGSTEEVATDLVAGVRPGDRLLCHAGVALERVEGTDFLYPFLAAQETDAETVLAEVAASTLRKGQDAVALRRGIDLGAVGACGTAVREALRAGGRLLAFGNGGSATDAQDLVADALEQGWPAAALGNDAATVTAVANDVGFENVYARQLIALGRPGDLAVAVSTSGSSANVVAALREARRRGMLCVAICGYDGGTLSDAPFVDHLLAVAGDYVPRLQEAHATIYHLLLEVVGDR